MISLLTSKTIYSTHRCYRDFIFAVLVSNNTINNFVQNKNLTKTIITKRQYLNNSKTTSNDIVFFNFLIHDR